MISSVHHEVLLVRVPWRIWSFCCLACTACVNVAITMMVLVVTAVTAMVVVAVSSFLVVLVVVFCCEMLLLLLFLCHHLRSVAHLQLPALVEFLHFCRAKFGGQLPQSESCSCKLEGCLSPFCVWSLVLERLFA